MARPKRDMHRVALYIPNRAREAVKRIQSARLQREGLEPLAADVWREAMARGLEAIEAEVSGRARRAARP